MAMKSSASTEGTLDTAAGNGDVASDDRPGLKKNKKQSTYTRSLSLNAKLHGSTKFTGSFADIAIANYNSTRGKSEEGPRYVIQSTELVTH